jgi:predicted transcriptional regulator
VALSSGAGSVVGEASGGKVFVLSIRPTYVERILDGRKTIELRRRFPTSAACGSSVLVYSTSPVQSLVATASLESVI